MQKQNILFCPLQNIPTCLIILIIKIIFLIRGLYNI